MDISGVEIYLQETANDIESLRNEIDQKPEELKKERFDDLVKMLTSCQHELEHQRKKIAGKLSSKPTNNLKPHHISKKDIAQTSPPLQHPLCQLHPLLRLQRYPYLPPPPHREPQEHPQSHDLPPP